MSGIADRRSRARNESAPGYHERRKQLLAAAAEVFQKKGFQAASISDIAERFGGDRASVYYYYAGKQEIFADLLRETVTEGVEAVERIAAAPESAAVRLERLLITTMELYERHYPYMYVYIQEDMRLVPDNGTEAHGELVELDQRLENALRKVVEQGFADGAFRVGLDANVLIFALTGAVNWTHRWFVPGGPQSGRQVGAAMAEIFLNGVQAGRRRKPVKPAKDDTAV